MIILFTDEVQVGAGASLMFPHECDYFLVVPGNTHFADEVLKEEEIEQRRE